MTTGLLTPSNEQITGINVNPSAFESDLSSIVMAELSLAERPRIRVDKIRIIPNTIETNRDLILQVKKSFPYVPDNSSILNAMVIAGSKAGKFDVEDVKEHICEAFKRPGRVTLDESKILRLKLLPEPFKVCKEYRMQIGRELFFMPDIHTVTNALLCTGDITPQEVVKALCDMYQNPETLRVETKPLTTN